MVPDNSTGIPRVPAYSGGAPAVLRFAYGALTLYGPAFLPVPLASSRPLSAPITPARAFRHRRFGLLPVRSPLLGESFLLSLPAGTKMFQFPAFAPCYTVAESLPPGCPIRTSAGLCAFAARRSFSQLVTSFLASESLGILHTPLSFRYSFNSRQATLFSPFLICSCETLLCFYSCLLASRNTHL